MRGGRLFVSVPPSHDGPARSLRVRSLRDSTSPFVSTSTRCQVNKKCTYLLFGEHVAHAIAGDGSSGRRRVGSSPGGICRCGTARRSCCCSCSRVSLDRSAAAAPTAWQRDELWEGPSIEIERNVRRRL